MHNRSAACHETELAGGLLGLYQHSAPSTGAKRDAVAQQSKCNTEEEFGCGQVCLDQHQDVSGARTGQSQRNTSTNKIVDTAFLHQAADILDTQHSLPLQQQGQPPAVNNERLQHLKQLRILARSSSIGTPNAAPKSARVLKPEAMTPQYTPGCLQHQQTDSCGQWSSAQYRQGSISRPPSILDHAVGIAAVHNVNTGNEKQQQEQEQEQQPWGLGGLEAENSSGRSSNSTNSAGLARLQQAASSDSGRAVSNTLLHRNKHNLRGRAHTPSRRQQPHPYHTLLPTSGGDLHTAASQRTHSNSECQQNPTGTGRQQQWRPASSVSRNIQPMRVAARAQVRARTTSPCRPAHKSNNATSKVGRQGQHGCTPTHNSAVDTLPPQEKEGVLQLATSSCSQKDMRKEQQHVLQLSCSAQDIRQENRQEEQLVLQQEVSSTSSPGFCHKPADAGFTLAPSSGRPLQQPAGMPASAAMAAASVNKVDGVAVVTVNRATAVATAAVPVVAADKAQWTAQQGTQVQGVKRQHDEWDLQHYHQQGQVHMQQQQQHEEGDMLQHNQQGQALVQQQQRDQRDMQQHHQKRGAHVHQQLQEGLQAAQQPGPQQHHVGVVLGSEAPQGYAVGASWQHHANVSEVDGHNTGGGVGDRGGGGLQSLLMDAMEAMHPSNQQQHGMQDMHQSKHSLQGVHSNNGNKRSSQAMPPGDAQQLNSSGQWSTLPPVSQTLPKPYHQQQPKPYQAKPYQQQQQQHEEENMLQHNQQGQALMQQQQQQPHHFVLWPELLNEVEELLPPARQQPQQYQQQQSWRAAAVHQQPFHRQSFNQQPFHQQCFTRQPANEQLQVNPEAVQQPNACYTAQTSSVHRQWNAAPVGRIMPAGAAALGQSEDFLQMLQEDAFKAAAFDAWKAATRAAARRRLLLEQTIQVAHCTHLLSVCLHAWWQLTAAHTAALQLALQARTPHRAWLGRSVLRAWRATTLEAVSGEHAGACTLLLKAHMRGLLLDWLLAAYTCRSMKRAALAGWSRAVQQAQAKRLARRMADVYSHYSTQRRVFHAWVRHRRCEALVQEAMALRSRRLQAAVLLAWQQHTSLQKQEAGLLLLQHVIGAWRQTTAACSYHRCRVLSGCLTAWRRLCQDRSWQDQEEQYGNSNLHSKWTSQQKPHLWRQAYKNVASSCDSADFSEGSGLDGASAHAWQPAAWAPQQRTPQQWASPQHECANTVLQQSSSEHGYDVAHVSSSGLQQNELVQLNAAEELDQVLQGHQKGTQHEQQWQGRSHIKPPVSPHTDPYQNSVQGQHSGAGSDAALAAASRAISAALQSVRSVLTAPPDSLHSPTPARPVLHSSSTAGQEQQTAQPLSYSSTFTGQYGQTGQPPVHSSSITGQHRQTAQPGVHSSSLNGQVQARGQVLAADNGRRQSGGQHQQDISAVQGVADDSAPKRDQQVSPGKARLMVQKALTLLQQQQAHARERTVLSLHASGLDAPAPGPADCEGSFGQWATSCAPKPDAAVKAGEVHAGSNDDAEHLLSVQSAVTRRKTDGYLDSKLQTGGYPDQLLSLRHSDSSPGVVGQSVDGLLVGRPSRSPHRQQGSRLAFSSPAGRWSHALPPPSPEVASIPSISAMRSLLHLPADAASTPAGAHTSLWQDPHTPTHHTSTAVAPKTPRSGQQAEGSGMKACGGVSGQGEGGGQGVAYQAESSKLHLLEPGQLLQLLEADVVWFDGMLKDGGPMSGSTSPTASRGSVPGMDSSSPRASSTNRASVQRTCAESGPQTAAASLTTSQLQVPPQNRLAGASVAKQSSSADKVGGAGSTSTGQGSPAQWGAVRAIEVTCYADSEASDDASENEGGPSEPASVPSANRSMAAAQILSLGTVHGEGAAVGTPRCTQLQEPVHMEAVQQSGPVPRSVTALGSSSTVQLPRLQQEGQGLDTLVTRHKTSSFMSRMEAAAAASHAGDSHTWQHVQQTHQSQLRLPNQQQMRQAHQQHAQQPHQQQMQLSPQSQLQLLHQQVRQQADPRAWQSRQLVEQPQQQGQRNSQQRQGNIDSGTECGDSREACDDGTEECDAVYLSDFLGSCPSQASIVSDAAGYRTYTIQPHSINRIQSGSHHAQELTDADFEDAEYKAYTERVKQMHRE